MRSKNSADAHSTARTHKCMNKCKHTPAKNHYKSEHMNAENMQHCVLIKQEGFIQYKQR